MYVWVSKTGVIADYGLGAGIKSKITIPSSVVDKKLTWMSFSSPLDYDVKICKVRLGKLKQCFLMADEPF